MAFFLCGGFAPSRQMQISSSHGMNELSRSRQTLVAHVALGAVDFFGVEAVTKLMKAAKAKEAAEGGS